jgi:hypothetical protein
MNRRKAIYTLFLLGTGTAVIYSGFKFYQANKKPDFSLLDEHADLIAALTENIIPRTDTPGAIDVNCADTLIFMIKYNADRKTQNNFIEGIRDLLSYTASKYERPFQSLPFASQQQIMLHFYEQGKNYSGKMGKVKNKLMGQSFFDILKQYTSIAYCTSKEGATVTMAYSDIPGTYAGCVPLKAGQKSWSTK